jgi:hypothetical protein
MWAMMEKFLMCCIKQTFQVVELKKWTGQKKGAYLNERAPNQHSLATAKAGISL